MFTSKAMRVFITLYQEGSLQRAADKLCLTVPPISRMLKMTEEWVGEKLFVINRNNIVPTQAAKSIYCQLLPHYYALNQVFRKQPGGTLQISSPQSNSSVLADVFQHVFPLLQTPVAINDVACIHDDDEIFISFEKVNAPTYFEATRVDILLSLICPVEFSLDWKNKMLLIEKAITRQPGFQKALTGLRIHGFTGHLHQVDNAVCLNSNFQNGDGLMFKLTTTAQNGYHILPFVYHQPLYIYTNAFKKCIQHEVFTSHVRRVVDLKG